MTNFDQPFPDYELLDRVGGGAMGTVFKARHKRLGRIVALKILKPSLARDKRYVERLRREARIVASLSHPHIVTGYDLGEEGGYHFFVMEFVEGKSLRQLLVEWGMFAEEYVLRVARGVAEALDHAYQRDVIHRDIKPGNILIDEAGRVKLTDMGLAKGPADLTLTRDGATVGTPMYISPEQARNPQDVDVRSDLYSLGATIYHMATGVPPFAGNTMAELITSVLNETVVPPSEANSAVSDGLSLVIRKLLAKNLSTRYQTPRELLDDLDRLDQALPPSVNAARLDAVAASSSRWLRPASYAAGALLLAAGSWWLGQQMVEPRVVEPDAAQFLAALDSELAAMASAGAKHQRLRSVAAPPLGAIGPLERRRVQVTADLQAALDGAVDALQRVGADDLEAWLRDPRRWPSAARFDREQLLPRIREACGVELAQLPASVRLDRVEALRDAVRERLRLRDDELLARFEQHLVTFVAGRANSNARLGRFAEAIGDWQVALTAFCDGVSRPLPELLSADMRGRLTQQLRERSERELAMLSAAEKAVVHAMRSHVTRALRELRADLTEGGADPEAFAAGLRKLRGDLARCWPAPACFEVGRDPWPEIEQELAVAEQSLAQHRLARAARRFDRRCDSAWRVYCHGDAVSALAVLDDAEPVTERQRRELVEHRRCLAAARDVGAAILQRIAARTRGTVGFLAGGAEPFALRVEPFGAELRLVGEAVDQPARAMRITELRIGSLLQTIGLPEGLSADAGGLGLTVLRLAAGDTGDLHAVLAELGAAERAFVFEQVTGRIQLAQGQELRGVAVDVESLLAMLEQAMSEVEQGGSPRELTRALLRIESRPRGDLTGRQARLLREARRRRDLALRRANMLADLRAEIAADVRADVRIDDDELVALLRFSAAALQGGAGDGWLLRNDQLEFGGGVRPFTELPQWALRAAPGDARLGKHTRLELELSFPDPQVGDRSYLIQFDGVSLVVVLAANDSVQVELLDGATLDEARARRAYSKALTGAFAPARATVVPAALHRLSVDVVQLTPNQANVVVAFEGKEMLRRLYEFDAKTRPAFCLYPMQEVSVRAASLWAFGL